MYGFKRCDKDEIEATKFYRQAAELNHEAMVRMAQIYLSKINKYLKGRGENLNTDQGENLEKMWYWLEKSADLGWISCTLFYYGFKAEKSGSWELSESVNRIFNEIIRKWLELVLF